MPMVTVKVIEGVFTPEQKQEMIRWNAFLPWPQALRAHCLAAAGEWDEALKDAEQAYALACQLGELSHRREWPGDQRTRSRP
jgi:hypothetical protein